MMTYFPQSCVLHPLGIALVLTVLALTPTTGLSQTDFDGILKKMPEKETTQYCNRFVEILLKPISRPAVYPGSRSLPDPAIPVPTPADRSKNAPAPTPGPADPRFELKSEEDAQSAARNVEQALEKAIGKHLYYSDYRCVQLAHVDKSKGERLVTLLAMRLSTDSLADVQQFFSDTSYGPGPGNSLSMRLGFQHKIVGKNVLLILLTKNAADPSQVAASQTRLAPGSSGTTRTQEDIDKRLAQLDNSDKPATPSHTNAVPSVSSGRRPTPEQMERYRSSMGRMDNEMRVSSDMQRVGNAFSSLGKPPTP